MGWHPAPTPLAPLYWAGGDPAVASNTALGKTLLIPAGTWQTIYASVIATDDTIDPRPTFTSAGFGSIDPGGGRYHLLGDGVSDLQPLAPVMAFNASQLVKVDPGPPLAVDVQVLAITGDDSAYQATLAVTLVPATPIGVQ